jgi:hypothetical protein
METITLQKHVGADGILDLHVPLSVRDADVQVTVTYPSTRTALKKETDFSSTTGSQWPEGFFERTYGSLANEPLEREPEGDFEIRDAIE